MAITIDEGHLLASMDPRLITGIGGRKGTRAEIDVIKKVHDLQPSERGELEITDLNNLYLKEGSLDVSFVKGKWLDTGTFESLHEAIIFARNRELADLQ